MQVPYVDLATQHQAILPELMDAVRSVLESAQFILGAEVERFEDSVARYCEAKHAVGLNSGTDALILALRALRIGEGDEVITVANSFVATASAIVMAGATPVFVDVRDDMNMDPDLLTGALTERTRAILPVHLTGRPAAMDEIMAFANQHSLHVVEDCAQAIGARLNDQHVGTFGQIGCFSVHPLKNLAGCGDGGFIITNSAEIATEVRILRNIGLESRDCCVSWSGNSRLDALQAAMLNVKLQHLDAWTQARRANAERYSERLRSLVTVPHGQPSERAVYHTYVIQTDARSSLQSFLDSRGIGTAVHYPTPIHQQPCAQPYSVSLPVTEEQSQKVLSLPVYPSLTEEQTEYVAEQINLFFSQSAG